MTDIEITYLALTTAQQTHDTVTIALETAATTHQQAETSLQNALGASLITPEDPDVKATLARASQAADDASRALRIAQLTKAAAAANIAKASNAHKLAVWNGAAANIEANGQKFVDLGIAVDEAVEKLGALLKEAHELDVYLMVVANTELRLTSHHANFRTKVTSQISDTILSIRNGGNFNAFGSGHLNARPRYRRRSSWPCLPLAPPPGGPVVNASNLVNHAYLVAHGADFVNGTFPIVPGTPLGIYSLFRQAGLTPILAEPEPPAPTPVPTADTLTADQFPLTTETTMQEYIKARGRRLEPINVPTQTEEPTTTE